ncbi:hypothetical protein C3489_09010 [Streptomyces sp. Ru71]|uniref:hypothetical protein n=1 Tax=Streptomyces sp. Ru71 TaxID=2080746 RepID=UPI000CDE2C18|nr:hypothetical protein [Streptomyces sp. Ru71]POX55718.1 hypothetical protein C3489_09010 [Streptomyces sp. Ru71]
MTPQTPRLALAAATALTGALALTACSGGSGGKDDGKDATPRTPTASAPQSPTATPTPAGDLDGNWLTTNGGKAIVLVITGKQAGLFTTGGSVCNGEAESRTIHLKCANGAAGDRTTGRVDSVDKSSLKVTWEGDVGTETYTRSEGGKVPPRLPTAGLGS